MERKQSTETKKRVIRRSVSHGAKNQDIDGGNGLVSAKSLLDEGDGKQLSHQHDDRKPDFVAKNKGKALQNKLKRYLCSVLPLSDRLGPCPGNFMTYVYSQLTLDACIFDACNTCMCVWNVAF